LDYNLFDRKFEIALNSLKNHKRLLINEFREELALSALEIATKSFKLLISNLVFLTSKELLILLSSVVKKEITLFKFLLLSFKTLNFIPN
jgi:hypothetical protein